MKIPLSFLLLSLFIFVATTRSLLFTGSDVVYDTAGNKLVTGNPYYVLPTLHGSGGGLTVSRNSKNACPLNVTQEGSEFSQGVPFTFNPIVLDEKFVRVSYPTSIQAAVTNPCSGSTIWKVAEVAAQRGEVKIVMDGDDPPVDFPAVRLVTTGGELNIPESCFQIVENDIMPGTQSYQIQHCPFKCGSSSATFTCYGIGVISDGDGKNYLAPTEALFPVVFASSFGKFTQSGDVMK